jgi:hypothetical protein
MCQPGTLLYTLQVIRLGIRTVRFLSSVPYQTGSTHGLINYIDTKAKCPFTGKFLKMMTFYKMFLYRSIYVDDDILLLCLNS